MKVGDRVRHPKLGIGTIIIVGKRGYLIDFSSPEGVVVRGSSPELLELIDEQERTEADGTKDPVSDRNSRTSETPRD